MNSYELFNIELGVVASYISSLENNSNEQKTMIDKYNAIYACHYKEMINAKNEAEKEEIDTKYTKELTKLVKSKDIYFDRLLVVSKDIIRHYTKKLIPEDIFQDYINYYLELLPKIKNLKNDDAIFKAILIVILNELFYYDNSQVIDYIYTNEVLKDYLNEAIINALKPYKHEDELDELLRQKEVSEDGYIDMDILNYLLRKNNIFTFKVNNEAKKRYAEVKEAEKSLNELNSIKEGYYHVKRKINKEASALALTAILSTAVGLLGGIIVKRMHDKVVYDTSVESLNENLEISQSNKYLDKIDGGSAIYVIDYLPWERVNNGFVRDAKAYDVTYIGYDDLAKYLLLDLESLGIIPKNFNQEKELLMPEDLYDDDITNVVRLTQSKFAEGVHLEKEYSNAEKITISASIVLLVTVAIFSITKRTLNIKHLKNTLLDNELTYKELRSDIIIILNQYKNCNRKIEELKDTFYAFCEKYDYLISDDKVLNEYDKMRLERVYNYDK